MINCMMVYGRGMFFNLVEGGDMRGRIGQREWGEFRGLIPAHVRYASVYRVNNVAAR